MEFVSVCTGEAVCWNLAGTTAALTVSRLPNQALPHIAVSTHLQGCVEAEGCDHTSALAMSVKYATQ